MKTKIENRTGIDFSDYEVIVEESENLLVHTLKRDGFNSMYKIKFINTNGIMAVTGDYGNWIFCREFHPSENGYVSSHYWLEKLHIASSQEGREFDSDETRQEIKEGINGGLEEYGYEDDQLERMKEFYEELLDYVDLSDWEYRAYAFTNYPEFLDSECVPHVMKTKNWLEVIFDGFDEICRRMKNN